MMWQIKNNGLKGEERAEERVVLLSDSFRVVEKAENKRCADVFFYCFFMFHSCCIKRLLYLITQLTFCWRVLNRPLHIYQHLSLNVHLRVCSSRFPPPSLAALYNLSTSFFYKKAARWRINQNLKAFFLTSPRSLKAWRQNSSFKCKQQPGGVSQKRPVTSWCAQEESAPSYRWTSTELLILWSQLKWDFVGRCLFSMCLSDGPGSPRGSALGSAPANVALLTIFDYAFLLGIIMISQSWSRQSFPQES